MVLFALKSVKGMPGFESFSQYRELDRNSLFSHFWLSVVEYLLICNFAETAYRVFNDVVAYGKKSLIIDRRHGDLIFDISNAMIKKDLNFLKKSLKNEAVFRLFEDLSSSDDGRPLVSVKNFNKLLVFVNIQVVEHVPSCPIIINGSKDPVFVVYLGHHNKNILFLHRPHRLSLKSPEIKINSKLEEKLNSEVAEEPLQTLNDQILEIESSEDPGFYLKKKVNNNSIDISLLSSSQNSFPLAYCGSYLCQSCSKKLKRTSFFIIAPKCCFFHIFNTSKYPVLTPSDQTESNLDCVFCSKPGSKKEQILCICCFLNKYVYKDKLKPFTSCSSCEKCLWIDINSNKREDRLVKCGFCDSKRNSDFICAVCDKCGDQVCLPCLRKNPFISEGLCSQCNIKRQVYFRNI